MVAGNEFLQKTEPWAQFKTDPKASAGILQVAINLIRIYAILSEPFIPETSRKLMESLNCDDWEWPRNVDLGLRKLPSTHSFSVPDGLFKKISDAERDAMEKRLEKVCKLLDQMIDINITPTANVSNIGNKTNSLVDCEKLAHESSARLYKMGAPQIL